MPPKVRKTSTKKASKASKRPAKKAAAKAGTRKPTSRAPRRAPTPKSARPRWRLRWPSVRARRRWLAVWRASPAAVRVVFSTALVVVLWAAINGVYQVVRKPSELFFPVSDALYKTPGQTWSTYGRLFERHSTTTLTPDLLAALAQVEGSGNPVARTYWRWSLRAHPFEVYRPASSAVGMFQITNGTFAEARRYCVHRHVVVEAAAWHDWRSCWFNGMYTRTVPSHAIEMTSAYLDLRVAAALAREGIVNAPLASRQRLAAVIHLCGAGAGTAFARRGLVALPGQRCGDHDLGAYLERIGKM
jgi:hypothetical protein